MQPGECLQALRDEPRILSHALRKRSLLYTVEYDTPAPTDIEHAPDRRNRKRHHLYCRVDRRLAECRGFSRRGPIELHDARAPLEYLGHISRREQSADGLTHRAALAIDAAEHSALALWGAPLAGIVVNKIGLQDHLANAAALASARTF